MKTSKLLPLLSLMFLTLIFTVACTLSVNQYNVSFYADNQLIETVKVDQGKAAIAPTAPTKEGYTFKSWDKSFSNITADLTINAVYEQNSYDVSFYNGDTLIEKVSVIHGNSAIAPTAPVKEGFTFKSWDKTLTNITSNLTVNAVFEQSTYFVSFFSGETFLETIIVKHGESVLAPTAPTKAGHTFKSWDKDISSVTSNLTVYAVYEAVSYNVSFYHGDTLIETVSVKYGESALAPTAPVKEGYAFKSWDKSFTNVTADLTVNAVYELNTYSVSFYSGDTLIETITVNHGGTVTAPNALDKVGHTFKSWDKSFTNVTTDLTVNAVYEINTFTVSFYDGETLIEAVKVNYGTAAVAPTAPIKEGFAFESWDKEFSNVTTDLTVNAIYKELAPVISLIGDTNNIPSWTGYSEHSPEFAIVEKGFVGVNFRIKSAFYGSEFKTAVNGSTLAGNTLVFYLNSPVTAEVFVRFFYADGTFVHLMVQSTPEGRIVEIPLSSFDNLNLSAVTHFGFFIQDWAGTSGSSNITVDSIAICDTKGLVLYKDTHQYDPIITIISGTDDASKWVGINDHGQEFAVIEDATIGVNLRIKAAFYGSDFKTAIDGATLKGHTLVFYVSAPESAEIFIRFYYADGSFSHYMIKSTPVGQIVELPLSNFVGLNLSAVTHFGFFIQDWAGTTNWTYVNVDSIAIVDTLGLIEYKETHVYEPSVSIVSEANDPAAWSATNGTNPAFAVVEAATEGLNLKFVSSHDGSEFKTAVDGSKLSGNTLSFSASAEVNAQIFVRFYYANGSSVHVMVSTTPEGQIIEIPLSSFLELDLASVTHFGFFVQDWATPFGWATLNIQAISIIIK